MWTIAGGILLAIAILFGGLLALGLLFGTADALRGAPTDGKHVSADWVCWAVWGTMFGLLPLLLIAGIFR